MERLTFDGNFCDIAQCRELPCRYDGNCSQKQVWERLKAYEDTGLSPKGLEHAWEIEDGLNEDGYSIERIVELMKADKEGRVMVLPCKVGDIIYRIFKERTKCSEYGETFDEYLCSGCECECDSTFQNVVRPIQPNTLPELANCIEKFNKTVFLTREEAEKALEARNVDQ